MRLDIVHDAARAIAGACRTNVFAALIVLDAVWIGLHAAHILTGRWVPQRLLLDEDRGVPEWFQYGKELAIVALLARLAHRTRELLFMGWAALFFYFFADDCLRLHERAGRWLEKQVSFSSGLGVRPKDLAEMTYVAMVGGGFAVGLGILAWKFAGRASRTLSVQLIALVVVLAGFGVVGDAAHSIVKGSAYDWLSIAEDGGEMITMSAILAVVVATVRSTPAPRKPTI